MAEGEPGAGPPAVRVARLVAEPRGGLETLVQRQRQLRQQAHAVAIGVRHVGDLDDRSDADPTDPQVKPRVEPGAKGLDALEAHRQPVAVRVPEQHRRASAGGKSDLGDAGEQRPFQVQPLQRPEPDRRRSVVQPHVEFRGIRLSWHHRAAPDHPPADAKLRDRTQRAVRVPRLDPVITVRDRPPLQRPRLVHHLRRDRAEMYVLKRAAHHRAAPAHLAQARLLLQHLLRLLHLHLVHRLPRRKPGYTTPVHQLQLDAVAHRQPRRIDDLRRIGAILRSPELHFLHRPSAVAVDQPGLPDGVRIFHIHSYQQRPAGCRRGHRCMQHPRRAHHRGRLPGRQRGRHRSGRHRSGGYWSGGYWSGGNRSGLGWVLGSRRGREQEQGERPGGEASRGHKAEEVAHHW